MSCVRKVKRQEDGENRACLLAGFLYCTKIPYLRYLPLWHCTQAKEDPKQDSAPIALLSEDKSEHTCHANLRHILYMTHVVFDAIPKAPP